MTVLSRPPVKFDKPPVVEVACGVSFELPKPLKSAHVGLYWSRVSAEFPRCDDAQPITPIFENPSAADPLELSLQLEPVSLPLLRRAWLINEPGTHLLQIQQDRFVFNWKRVDESPMYPSYAQVVADFRIQWGRFKDFLAEQDLGEASVTQLEMTYFNFVPGDDQPVLRDHVRDMASDRFLPVPEAVAIRHLYALPEGNGRLHVAASSARQASSGVKGTRIEMTARGLPRNTSNEGCDKWFDLAHEWITHGFADITTDSTHAIWGRTA